MASGGIQTLSSLLQKSTIDDHEQILKSCNAALQKSKNDLLAQHVKAVALLNLDRFEDALRVFEAGGGPLKDQAALEYAYTLYKCGRLKDAAEVAGRLGEGRGPKHVQAQANYRAEDFASAAKIYKLLSAAESEDERYDLRINTWATLTQQLWKRELDPVTVPRPTSEDLDVFEISYNAACASLARGDLREGELLLKRATEICKTSDSLSPEEKATELLPILVQQLFVQVQQGKWDEAEKLIREIDREQIDDVSVRNIADNNTFVVQQRSSNPYVIHKQFNELRDPPEKDKLFEFQQRSINRNSRSLDLLVHKYDGVIRSTAKALKTRPYPSTSTEDNMLSVYNAAAHVQNRSDGKTVQQLLPLLEQRPKEIGLLLTVVQLYANIGNYTSAMHVFERSLHALEESISESDQDVRFSPGLVCVLVSLYQKEGRQAQIRIELGKAASHWRQKSNPSPAILRAAAIPLLYSSEPADSETARHLFTSLHKSDPSDTFAIAGFVASHADEKNVLDAELKKLPSLQRLIADVDLAALEKAGVPQSSRETAATAAIIAGAKKRSRAGKEGGRATKRIRKSRLPKEYDPDKKPDPERWLPLRERSSYRPRGKKGKQRAAERTQGGIVNEKSEELAASAAAAGQQQKGSGGGGQSSKKKKKGKR